VGGIVVAHAGFRATDERGVAEDDPGFFRTGEERLPERLKGGGRGFHITGEGSGSGLSGKKESQKRASKEKRKNHHGEEPNAGNLLVGVV